MCVPYRNSAINASRSAFARNLAFRMTEVRQHFIFHDGHYTGHGHTHSVVNITLLVTMDIIYTDHGRALHKAPYIKYSRKRIMFTSCTSRILLSTPSRLVKDTVLDNGYSRINGLLYFPNRTHHPTSLISYADSNEHLTNKNC